MFDLESFCVRKVVENISRYNIAFLTSVDEHLKFCIEFLRRVYSWEIVEMLQEKRSWKTEYADFLINKYMGILDTRWLENVSPDGVIKKIIEMGPALERLIIRGNFHLIEWEKVICHVPNLKSVSYRDHCDDKFIYCIATFCPIIECIEITGSIGVSDQGIEDCFCNKSSKSPFSLLKEISIDSSNIGNDGVRSLIQNLTSLERVEYQKLGEVLYSLYKCDLVKGINTLDKASSCSLTHLSLTGDPSSTIYGDILKASISICHQLKSFACYVYNKEELEMCYLLPELEELDLTNIWPDENAFVCDTYVDNLLRLKGKMLISLHVSGFLVSASVMAQYCPRLCSLRLSTVYVDLEDSNDMPLFLNLKKIYFKSVKTISEMVCLMSASPNLKHLHFEECRRIFVRILCPIERTRFLKYFEQCKLTRLCFIKCGVVSFILLKNILSTCSSLAYLNIVRSALGFEEDYHRRIAIELDRLCSSLDNLPAFRYSENFDGYWSSLI